MSRSIYELDLIEIQMVLYALLEVAAFEWLSPFMLYDVTAARALVVFRAVLIGSSSGMLFQSLFQRRAFHYYYPVCQERF